MASNPIDCIKLHAKYLSTDENISREAATDMALKEFEKLHGELENFKKSINPKYTKKAYISPDKSEAIKKITDDYQKQIDEANTPTSEPTKAQTPSPKEGEQPQSSKVGRGENPFTESTIKEPVYRAFGNDAYKNMNKQMGSPNGGIYLSADRKFVENFARSYKVPVSEMFVNLKNPKKIYLNHKESLKQEENVFNGKKLEIDKLTKEDIDALKEAGYDGVTLNIEPINGDPLIENREIVVFDKSQIKIINEPTQSSKVTEGGKGEGFTEGKDLNKIFTDLKAKYGDKKGSALYEVANRLVNPNKNTIIEIRGNGVVVKEGDKYILKPFGNTDANSKKWTLYKGLDVTDQFQKPKNETTQATTKGNESITTEKESLVGEAPTEDSGAAEEGEKINLTHAGTEEIYKEGDLPLRLETPTKHREQLEQEAEEKLQKGYDFDKVADETLSGNRKWEDTDQVLFERKVADLKAKQKGLDVLSPEFDKLQNQIEKYSRASDIAGTLGGRLLQSRKAGRDVEETISDYLIVEKELNQDAPLTDKQKETVQKEFTDIQKAQADYNQKIAELQAENARLKAEAEVKKAKATSKKGVKKDYAAERKEIFESIKEKLKKARQDTSATILPYAKELIAIAPEIGKLVKNLVDNGVDKLADIVKEIHSGLKEDIEGITEKDVRDLIAGEYNPKKPTRTELATKLFDLKRQAQLTNKLEALLRGEEPKNEQKKIRRNQGIENLKSQIKEFEKAKKDAEKEPVEKKTPDEIALQAIKTRTQKELDKINEQLRTGDFSKPEKKEATKLDREAIELKDKLIKARQEREIRILKQEYANRSKYEKAKQNALEVLNVPRTIMSSMDYSAPLRQGLWAGISHPRTMGLAGIEMFKQSLSQKRFDRWFHDLRETPRYETMEKSGLYVADPHDPRLSAKEEAFMNNLAEKIPFLGKLIKGSERAYVGFLNKMRVDLFNRFADRYEEQGRTVENSPELYKSMADYINNSTGRGKLGPLENYAPLFNTAFFSPRLMASRINLLTMPFTPKFYSKEVPKQIRIMYAKDLFKFLALGTSVLALAKLNGAQVEDDPRSSDFGKIHDKNTRWDVWGGFQPYVRLAAQMVTGEKKSTNSGEIQNLNGEGRFGTNRMDVFGQFLRGKLSPVPGMAVDFVKGKDAVGNDVTIGGEAESHLLPLLYSDLKEAIKDRGVSALFTVGVPSIFGVGTNTYSPRPPAKPRKQTTGKPQGPKKEKM